LSADDRLIQIITLACWRQTFCLGLENVDVLHAPDTIPDCCRGGRDSFVAEEQQLQEEV